MSKYPKELKDKIIRLHLEEGRTLKSLTQEFHLGTGTITYWLKELRKECQNNPYIEDVNFSLEEKQHMLKELRELRKENEFLKKAAAFFAREID